MPLFSYFRFVGRAALPTPTSFHNYRSKNDATSQNNHVIARSEATHPRVASLALRAIHLLAIRNPCDAKHRPVPPRDRKENGLPRACGPRNDSGSGKVVRIRRGCGGTFGAYRGTPGTAFPTGKNVGPPLPGWPLRHDHQKDQVKLSSSLRGAKRRGNP